VKLEDGDLQGMLQVASDAVSEAETRTTSLKVDFGRPAVLSASVIILFASVGSLWGLEHFISNTRLQVPMVGKQAADEMTNAPEESMHLPALDSLRYFLSFMMLLYNFYPWTVEGVQGRVASFAAAFASWGILAPSVFFVLSGFCHSYMKLTGKMKAEAESMGPTSVKRVEVKEDMLSAMIVRVMVWYPYYVLVLVFLAMYYLSYNAEDWANFMAQLFLIGGAFTEHGTATFPYFPSSWWFSFLMIYLLAWLPMHQVLVESSTSVIWTMFTMATIACFPSVLLEWISFDDWAPYLLVQYCPSFFFGQALAVWQVRHCMVIKITEGKPAFTRQAEDELSFTARFGVTMSVLILGVIMILTSVYDRMAIFGMPCTSFFTKGLLLPVFGMLLVGLANEVDPIAKLCARRPVCYLGRLSLSQYMLALPVHIAVDSLTGRSGFSFLFVFCLTLASVVGYFCIEKPSRRLAAELKRRLRD